MRLSAVSDCYFKCLVGWRKIYLSLLFPFPPADVVLLIEGVSSRGAATPFISLPYPTPPPDLAAVLQRIAVLSLSLCQAGVLLPHVPEFYLAI